jgi:hypothetical protein
MRLELEAGNDKQLKSKFLFDKNITIIPKMRLYIVKLLTQIAFGLAKRHG